MKLLEKVNILGKTFKVEYFDFEKVLQCNNMNGNALENQQRIQIDSTIHREKQESTLLHEIIHILSYSLNLELDEKAVCLLESGIYQVLKDNNLFK